jgi:hypothetical protein
MTSDDIRTRIAAIREHFSKNSIRACDALPAEEKAEDSAELASDLGPFRDTFGDWSP